MAALCDSSRLERNVMQAFQSINATTPGQDGITRVIRGEATASFRNATKANRVITAITL